MIIRKLSRETDPSIVYDPGWGKWLVCESVNNGGGYLFDRLVDAFMSYPDAFIVGVD